MGSIKVLVVDDSALMRKTIKELLETDPGIKVIESAKNGREAIDKIYEFKPDVVTLDIHMPVMDGYEALKIIMKDNPLPVVIVSSLTQEEAPLTLKLLDLGAYDYVPKPGGTISLNIKIIKDEMIQKVKRAYLYRTRIVKKTVPLRKKFKTLIPKEKQRAKYVVAIGISTGGPATLIDILQNVRAPDNDVAYLVAQHMPVTFTKTLAARLGEITPIPFGHAVNGEAILGGRGYLAPGNFHMMVTEQLRIRLVKDNKHLYYPSADVLFESIADMYAPNAIGVILTGIGKDGAQGLLKMRTKGCHTIAESEKTAVVYGMPREAAEIGAAQVIKDSDEIHVEINRFLSRIRKQ